MPQQKPDSPAGQPPSPDFQTAWALVTQGPQSLMLSRDGEVAEVNPRVLAQPGKARPLVLVHAPFVAQRLGTRLGPRSPAIFDLAELFAFVHPAVFATPTPRGLAAALNMPAGPELEDEAALVHTLADQLLEDLAALRETQREQALAAAAHMKRKNWAWGDAVVAALRLARLDEAPPFEPWRHLPEWEDEPPRPEPGQEPVLAEEASAHLAHLVGAALGPDAQEARTSQADYAKAAAEIFAPRAVEGQPTLVLAEAGTGIGKTLGYLAPSTLWARKNKGSVWISTYTKNLQRQIAQTLRAVEAQDGEDAPNFVVRKGRENYVCLLNLQEATQGTLDGVAVGLVGRWLQATADGDMIGGDFPSWLAPLMRIGSLSRGMGPEALGLTDRRGECVYGACNHYRRCFIERVGRQAEAADIIVGNHALTLIRAAGDAALPEHLQRRALSRMVLDEGHHLFDAADSVFSAHLTANEMADLRRWIRGPEERTSARRSRTLVHRLDTLLDDDPDAEELLQGALRAAHQLPSEHWRQHMRGGFEGPAYRFLAAMEAQVRARTTERRRDEITLECPARPASDEVLAAAEVFAEVIRQLSARLGALARRLADRLVEKAEDLSTYERGRLESVVRSLMIRTETVLPAWRQMLESLAMGEPEGYVDWFATNAGANDQGDTGMHRHAIDPTQPLAKALYKPAHGVLVTSATLFDTPPDKTGVHASIITDTTTDNTGAKHLESAPIRLRFPSPFPYAETTKFLVVRDVDTRQIDHLAAAMRVLMQASGGGALGLFTAIARLRAVHQRISAPLAAMGLPLYAQHIDDMDTGTLVDIFRFETNSCLLGTDAVRDGIDVPGRSLRLIVLERVPWARPDLLHKARREAFGGRAFEEDIVRRRISQGFGRLIRRTGDKGVFVLLGAQTPSRLLSGLPEGVEVERTGLADAARQIHAFL